MLFEKSKHQLVIVSNSKIRVEGTIFFINVALYEKSGMGRHPAVSKFSGVILRSLPIPDDLVNVILIHIQKVSVTAIHIVPLKNIHNSF